MKGVKGFQKGNRHGKGRPRVPEDIMEIRTINKLEVERVLSRFLNKSVDELVEFSTDKRNPTLEVLVARVLVEAIRSGDERRLDFVFTRLIGKPMESTIITHQVKENYHSKIMDMIDEFEGRDVTPKLLEEPFDE